MLKRSRDLPDLNRLSYVVGVSFSDGSVKNEDNRIILRVTDKPFAEKFVSVLKGMGFRPRKGMENKSYRVTVTSKTLNNFMKKLEGKKIISNLNPYFLFEGLYEGDGCLELKQGKYIRIRINMKEKRKKWILPELAKKLWIDGIKARIYESKSGVRTFLIRERYSIYKLFTHTNPIMRNPRTCKLSQHHEISLRKRGINPEKYKESIKKRWKEVERNWKIINMDTHDILKILLTEPELLRQAIKDKKVRRSIIPLLGSIWTQTGTAKLLSISESVADNFIQKFRKKLFTEEIDSKLRNMIIKLTRKYNLFKFIQTELRIYLVRFLATKYRDTKKVASILGTNRKGIYNYGRGIWSEMRDLSINKE